MTTVMNEKKASLGKLASLGVLRFDQLKGRRTEVSLSEQATTSTRRLGLRAILNLAAFATQLDVKRPGTQKDKPGAYFCEDVLP